MSRMTSAVLLAVATVIGVLGVILTLDGEPAQPVPLPFAVTLTSPPPAPRGVPVRTFGAGRHRVISEIAAGTYRTGGSSTPDWPMCSYKIFKGERIVSSGTATGPTTITVEPAHDEVESRGCLEWRRVGDVP